MLDGRHTMFERRRIKCCIFLVLVVMVVLHLHLSYFCSERQCTLTEEVKASNDLFPAGHFTGDSGEKSPNIKGNHQLPPPRFHLTSYVADPCSATLDPDDDAHVEYSGGYMFANGSSSGVELPYKFDPEGDRDVMVFLHVQKTGGTTFGRHLVRDLEMRTPCVCNHGNKKCGCQNARDLVWLVSRYTTGWRCGLHADWTELTSCVDGMLDKVEPGKRERRYMYVTILRDPVTRYLSEFKHVQRGATWRAARLQCDGHQASLQELPFCFDGDDWKGVSLDDFMSCPHNLANNRQTRMLANLSLVGCYRHLSKTGTQRQCDMLKSAKDNLRKLAFFGLTEYQLETQYMFERTFGLKFKKDFYQYSHTHSSEVDLTSSQMHRIKQLNSLDISLYQYAKSLFLRRLHTLLRNDNRMNTLDVRFPKRTDVHGFKSFPGDSNVDFYEEEENELDNDDTEYNQRFPQ